MREQVVALLQTLPPDRQLVVTAREARIVCPNPDHSGGHERSGSFGVCLEVGPRLGSHNCFGCDWHGGWKKTCERLGFGGASKSLQVRVPYDVVPEGDADEMLGKRRRVEDVTDLGHLEDWPTNENWRGISGRLVRAVGGQMLLGGDGREPSLVLPAYVRGKKVGWVKCRVLPQRDGLDYLNKRGEWSKHALFPYDFVRERLDDAEGLRVVTVVEGTRDALQNIANGVLALATLGAKAWSSKCASLVRALSPDVCVVMADPDDAGDMLVASVRESLSPYMSVKVVMLPHHFEKKEVKGKMVRKKVKDLDPADLNRAQLRVALSRVGIDLDAIDVTSERYALRRKKEKLRA